MLSYLPTASQSTIAGLDELKAGADRINKGARDATKYLEQLLRDKRSSKVRVQQPHETTQVDVELMQSAPAHALLLSCALFFAADAPDASMVTVLTADPALAAAAEACQVPTRTSSEFLRAYKAAQKKKR